MEILMKLKCSPSTPTHGNNSTTTLKVVDHHHQLTQQHATLPPPQSLTASATVPPSLVRLPTQRNVNYNNSSPAMALHTMPPRMPTTTRSCMNYPKPMDCCNQQEVELYDAPPWREPQGRRGVPYDVAMQRPPAPSCCAEGSLYEAPTCCSAACRLPGCGATPPMAPPPTQSQLAPILHQAPAGHPPPLAYSVTPADDCNDGSVITGDYNAHYEYQEPEENFVSIEDTNIKSLLMKIGREYAEEKKERERAKRREESLRALERDQTVVFEIIELDEDDSQERPNSKLQAGNGASKTVIEPRALHHDGLTIMEAPAGGCEKPKSTRMKSPSISLIPKRPSPKPTVVPNPPQREEANQPSKERIIAHIDLSDSSDSEVEQCEQTAQRISNRENQVQRATFQSAVDRAGDYDDDDDSDELSYAAAAVSCELDCEDDDNLLTSRNTNDMSRSNAHSSNADDDVVILNSDDDDNAEYIQSHEIVKERLWKEYEHRAKGRQFYECHLCNKQVQSSYNLRRHMMIHTGERPFACDMCDRRFREFSDLKKHRRRHANEANFVCMVCRVRTPTLYDPTRCNECDSKTSALLATMQPQVATSPAATTPDHVQTPPTAARPTTPRQPPPQLTAKPILITNVRELGNTTMTTTTNNSNNRMTAPSSPALLQRSVTQANTSPKRPSSNTTTLPSTAEMPSLVPINSPLTVNKTVNTDTQSLLDNVPAVHRSKYNQTTGIIMRKEYPCPLCKRAFGTRHNLKRHFMIHTGEKPFSCDKCRKPFREYSTLKKHMVTHQRERYYKCLRCPCQYTDYLEYCEHKKTHAPEEGVDGMHNDDDDEDDDDEIMNFDISSASSASAGPHKRAKMLYESSEDNSSMEDNWLECCECKQRYTDIDAYTKHLKEHDPTVFLYECYICKKTFEKRDELVEHVGACKVELRETALSQQRAKCFN